MSLSSLTPCPPSSPALPPLLPSLLFLYSYIPVSPPFLLPPLSLLSLLSPTEKDEESLSRFKQWFWSVVERMSLRERQDLLYFWTSSPALPANPESYQPAPSITIRPPDDSRLPTANTCISRLYLPLYSSRSTLRQRLLTALKTRTFGFV